MGTREGQGEEEAHSSAWDGGVWARRRSRSQDVRQEVCLRLRAAKGKERQARSDRGAGLLPGGAATVHCRQVQRDHSRRHILGIRWQKGEGERRSLTHPLGRSMSISVTVSDYVYIYISILYLYIYMHMEMMWYMRSFVSTSHWAF